jgi:hypothetical protein
MEPVTEKHIEFLDPRREGFFQYKEQLVKCPALVMGKIKLPIAPYTNVFFLVRDRAGEYHWVPSNKVSFATSREF